MFEKLFEKLHIDPEDRSMKIKLAAVAAALVGFLVIIMMSSASSSTKKVRKHELLVDEPYRKESKEALLQLPEGEDNDILDATSIISIMERHKNDRKNTGLKDLYENGQVEQEDPMAPKKGLFDTAESQETSREDRLAALRQMYGLADGSAAPAQEQQPGETPDDSPQVKSITGAIATPPSVSSAASATAASTRIVEDDTSHEPEMAAEAHEEKNDKGEQAPVQVPVRKTGGISSLDNWGTIDGISGLDEEDQYVTIDASKPVRVMFVKDQKISSGERVTLRLLDDIAAEGILIPKNTHLSAQCSVGERLAITVNNIEINGKILTLGYTAFDNDGNEGLYCPESRKTKDAKRAADQGLNIGTQLLGSAITGVAGNIVQSGTSMARSATNNRTAQISAGYTFYLLKDDY